MKHCSGRASLVILFFICGGCAPKPDVVAPPQKWLPLQAESPAVLEYRRAQQSNIDSEIAALRRIIRTRPDTEQFAKRIASAEAAIREIENAPPAKVHFTREYPPAQGRIAYVRELRIIERIDDRKTLVEVMDVALMLEGPDFSGASERYFDFVRPVEIGSETEATTIEGEKRQVLHARWVDLEPILGTQADSPH